MLIRPHVYMCPKRADSQCLFVYSRRRALSDPIRIIVRMLKISDAKSQREEEPLHSYEDRWFWERVRLGKAHGWHRPSLSLKLIMPFLDRFRSGSNHRRPLPLSVCAPNPSANCSETLPVPLPAKSFPTSSRLHKHDTMFWLIRFATLPWAQWAATMKCSLEAVSFWPLLPAAPLEQQFMSSMSVWRSLRRC